MNVQVSVQRRDAGPCRGRQGGVLQDNLSPQEGGVEAIRRLPRLDGAHGEGADRGGRQRVDRLARMHGKDALRESDERPQLHQGDDRLRIQVLSPGFAKVPARLRPEDLLR